MAVPYTVIAGLIAILAGISAGLNVAEANIGVALRASLVWLPVLLVACALLGSAGGLLARTGLPRAPHPRQAFLLTSAASAVILIGSLPVLAAIMAPSGTDPADTLSSGPVSGPGQTTSSEPAATSSFPEQGASTTDSQQNYAVGDTIEWRGAELTLTEVFIPEGQEPMGGSGEVVTAQIHLVNNSNEEVGNPLSFTMRAKQGYELDVSTLTSGFDETIKREYKELGLFPPGSDVYGTVSFVAQPGDSLMLEYAPALGTVGAWSIGPVSELEVKNITGGEQAAVEEAIRSHYEAIGRGDFEEAYSYFGPTFRSENSKESWISEEQSQGIQDSTINSVEVTEVSGDTATAEVDVEFEDNRGTPRFNLTWSLVKEDGEWKLDDLVSGEEVG